MKVENQKSIYLHIPYCKQVCYYCDFHFRVAMKDKAAMLAAMKKEITLRKDYLGSCENGRNPVMTLYFGGGTPSVLTIGELSGLLDVIHQYYQVDPDAEITLEANPDDLTPDYLSGLRSLGFNRLSIGIQSFFDDDLKWMNRRHNAAEGIRSVELARHSGFENLNVDLIYGLPSMTIKRWQENLDRLMELDVPHCSAYHLTIEPKTVFGRKQQRGEEFRIHEEESIFQFDVLLDTMEHNRYEHYEISNFARKGFYSRHNSAYWQQKPYIGIGPAAHSFNGHSRQWNIPNNSRYIDALHHDQLCFEQERLSAAEMYNDYIMLSLRTSWGVDPEYVRDRFGPVFLGSFCRQIISYIDTGFVKKQENNTFVLTRKGKLIADRIASDLFYGE